MKPTLYFFEDGRCAVMTIFQDGIEPEHAAKFELTDGQSQFTPRYSLVHGVLVDNYVGKTDDDVAVILQQIEVDKAAKLAASVQANKIS